MKKRLILFLVLLIVAVGADALAAARSEEVISQCPDLAVCDELVWRFSEGALICEDVRNGEIRAEMAISELYEPGDEPFRVSVTSDTGHSVLLALGLEDAAGVATVRLLQLGLSGGDIAVIKEYDDVGQLGFLADGGAKWYEVNMLRAGQRLFIAALDGNYQFNFFSYTPDADALVSLGGRPLDSYTAALPLGDDVLIVGPDPENDDLLTFTRLSLEDGSTELLEGIELYSALHASNFAWDESRERLYYTFDNMVYSLVPGGGKAPMAVRALPGMPAELRLGAVVGDQFVALTEQGGLLCCDINGSDAPETRLRVANIPGDANVTEAIRDFGVANPGCTVSVTNAVGEADILSAAIDHAPDYDAYVLTLNSDLYRALYEAGCMRDLSSSAVLSSAAADMTERISDAIQTDGALYAMPMSVGSYCQSLNIPAIQALTGLAREELPTDWRGFLALLGQLADSGALMADGGYCLLDTAMTADELRETLLCWMVQDSILWMEADGGAVDRLSEALTPALEAFHEIDWSRLISEKASSTGGMAGYGASGMRVDLYGGAQTPLLTDGMLDIAVSAPMEGMELWPLSIEPEGERLIGQAVTVLCVSPWSANPEASISLAEHAWNNIGIEMKMSLCQSMNQPVVNTGYQEDLDYMARDVGMLQQSIAAARDEAEKDYLQGELDELLGYMEDYRENAQWLVSDQSIADYRAFTDALVPTPPDSASSQQLNDLIYRFLNRELTPSQFLDRFLETT